MVVVNTKKALLWSAEPFRLNASSEEACGSSFYCGLFVFHQLAEFLEHGMNVLG